MPKPLGIMLFRALSEGDTSRFRSLVSAGVDVNVENGEGETPLHKVISWEKELKVVEAVLSSGSDPNAVSMFGFTPLHTAIACRSDVSVVKALIRFGADVNAKSSHSVTPLVSCCFYNSELAIVNALLKAGARTHDPDLPSKARKWKTDRSLVRTIMAAEALADGNPDAALVTGDLSDVDVGIGPKKGGSNHICLLKNQSFMLFFETLTMQDIEELLSEGFDVNTRDVDGLSPLYCASAFNNVSVVKTLLKAGADVNFVTARMRNSCLHVTRSPEIIRELISKGLDVNITNKDIRTPLHYVIYHSYPSPIRRILENGDNEESDVSEKALLAVEELLKRGADINRRDQKGSTPLHYAITGGGSKITAVLLNYRPDIYFFGLLIYPDLLRNAVKMVLKISLIRNLRSHCCAIGMSLMKGFNLEMYQYNLKCEAEVDMMKEYKLKNDHSLHEYVAGDPSDVRPLSDDVRVSKKLISRTYPIYRDVILARLEQCHKRTKLLGALGRVECAVFSTASLKTVILNQYCKLGIAEYLGNEELSNFIMAMDARVVRLSRQCKKRKVV